MSTSRKCCSKKIETQERIQFASNYSVFFPLFSSFVWSQIVINQAINKSTTENWNESMQSLELLLKLVAHSVTWVHKPNGECDSKVHVLSTYRRHPNSRPETSSGQCWSRKCIPCHSILNGVHIPADSPDTYTCDAQNVDISRINLSRHKTRSHHPLSETWISFSLSCHVRFSVKLIPTRWFLVITLFWMVRIVWVSTRNHATLTETN